MRPAKVTDDLKIRALAPDLESGGAALFTDVVTVPAGRDVMYCTYTNFISKEKVYIHDSKAVQTKYGHHATLQYSLTPQTPGTHECPANGLEQQQSRILGGMGEGQNVEYPPSVVSEVPAGAQLMINHHWINTSDSAIEAQAELITVPPPAGVTKLVVARSFNVLAGQFQIAPHATGQASATCTFDRDVQLISALGHMHEWGVHIKSERMGAEPDVLFDYDFDPTMAIEPKVDYYTLEAPYSFKKGESVRVTCQWNNTTDATLMYPGEMCVLSGWQIGSERDTICYDGQWM